MSTPEETGERQLPPALGWVLAILLTVFAVAPLTYPGFFESQTGFLPAFNFEHLSAAPNWGRLPDPVRGEGKLPYLAAWPFLQSTGSGVTAAKWGYGLAFVLASLAAYAWTRRWLGIQGGLLGAVVYTYLPWHLSTVYVRGAYAGAWMWVWLPLVLWAIDRLVEQRYVAAGVAGLLASVAALWTQPGLFALALPLLAAYGAAMTLHSRRPWARAGLALGVSWLLLSLAARLLSGDAMSADLEFLLPYQLLSAAWGDGLSFQLGLAATGLGLVAVVLWLGRGPASRWGDDGEGLEDSGPPAGNLDAALDRAFQFWLAALLLLVLLMLPVAGFIWRWSGLDALVKQPWQLLTLAGLPLAFLSGSILRLDQRLAALPAWAGLVALVVLASYPYLAPKTTGVDPGSEPVAMFQPENRETPGVMLLDYEIMPPTEVTPTLTLTITWQTVETLAEDYTVFVHALAGGETKAAQRDSQPCDGECPTSAWKAGEIVVDRHQFDLAPGAPQGPYRLAVGLYRLDTGERVAIRGRDDGTVVLDVP